MIDYHLLTLFLIGEAFILLFLMGMIVFHRIFRSFSDRVIAKKKDQFSQYYLSLIESKKPFSVQEHPKVGGNEKILLETIEEFKQRIGGELWYSIQKGVVDSFLISLARKRAKSFFWIKRNFSSRVFALKAYPEDEETILKLMDDKKFLVRSPASFASVYLESQRGVMKLVQTIKNEYGYSQFIYLDALIQGSEKVFQYLIDIAKDPLYHKIILKVLAARSWGRVIPFLESNFNSGDPEVRFLSLKVLMRNPLPNTSEHFFKGVLEQDVGIRALSLEGIGAYPTDQSSAILEKALNDSVWEVRLSAGKALKRLGQLGINILCRQKEGVALEVAKYVLVFG